MSLHYIEQLTWEHQANCERLERELTEERTARQQAEERLRQAEAQAAEAEKAQADLENTLAATQEELEKTTTALTQAKATAASLEEKLQDIEPEAASWRRIKDTAGGIEVAAHERAQVTLQTARAQAAEIRAEGPAGYGTFSPAANNCSEISTTPSSLRRRSWTRCARRSTEPRHTWKGCRMPSPIWSPVRRRQKKNHKG